LLGFFRFKANKIHLIYAIKGIVHNANRLRRIRTLGLRVLNSGGPDTGGEGRAQIGTIANRDGAQVRVKKYRLGVGFLQTFL
jgi:hypothetical protein